MPIIRKLIPLEEGELSRKVEIFDSSIPTKVLDEELLKAEKERLEEDIAYDTKNLVRINADLAIIEEAE